MATYLNEDAEFFCDICRATEKILIPDHLDRFIEQGNWFIERHKDCIAKAEKQKELEDAGGVCECGADLTCTDAEHTPGCSRDPRPTMKGEKVKQ